MFMVTGRTYDVLFRRRREGRTNYRKRLSLLKSGDRVVARKTSHGVIAQLVSYAPEGDRVVACATSKDIEKYGLPPSKNVACAYLVGYALAKRALAKGVKKAVLDIGRRTPVKSSFAFAVLKGVIDGGLEMPYDEKVFNTDRFAGKHISEHAKSLKGSNPEAYKKMFSQYLKMGIDPEALPQLIEKIKAKI